MKSQFQCWYCGYEWERDWYGSGSPRCPTCKDSQVKKRKTKDKVDYYAGDTESSEEPRTAHEFGFIED